MPTKYEDLCEAFRQSHVDGTAYYQRSVSFIARLLTGFQSYLGAPPERVAFLPPEPHDSTPNTVYTAMGAPKLGQDGWWVACVRLTLSQGKGVYPEAPVLFQFRVLAETNKFAVRLGDSDRTHTVSNGADATALEPIYEQAYDLANEYFTSGLQRFLDQSVKAAAARKIGFTTGP